MKNSSFLGLLQSTDIPMNNPLSQTMLMARHQKIAKLFDEDFWVTQ